MVKHVFQKTLQILTNKNTYVRIIKAVDTFLDQIVLFIERLLNSIPNWPNREIAHPAILRFGTALGLAAFAFGLKALIGPLFGSQPPYLFFYGVIVLSAWYGGTRPGLLALVVCTVLAHEFYLNDLVGSTFQANALASLFFFCEGILVIGISHSMHKALQIYEEKKRHSQYYARIAQHISDAVISTDMNLIIQSWNEGAELLYGWKEHEIIGKSIYELLFDKHHSVLKKSIQELILHGGHWKGEMVYKRKNGSRVYVLTSMSELHNKGESHLGIVFVNRDITDRKKLEQGKDDFIALASHELKTPLTSVKLYTGILKQRFEKSKDLSSLEYLSKVDSQISKLLELVNHLLDVSKAQAGKITFNFEEHFIDDFVHEIVHDIQLISKTHKIEIIGKTGCHINIDKDRFRQALVNILNNAIKYSAQADKVIVRLVKDHGDVNVSVQDFGVGIPKEKQEKIFDRFYQVADSKGYTYAGMGLGLYITREIIEKHQGKLSVTSEQGKGSTFTITLPSIKKHSHGSKKENSHR